MEIPDTLIDKKIYIPDTSHISCNEPDCPCLDPHFDLPGRRTTLRHLIECIAEHYREVEEPW